MFDPPIKIQGKKTRLLAEMRPYYEPIFAELDRVGGKWVEPFVGSGAVGFNFAVGRRAVFGDTNPHLIRFYWGVAHGELPAPMIRHSLIRHSEKLRESGATHYYDVRDRFNDTHDPLDFLFLSRVGFNGLLRFNKGGGFNTPYCKNDNKLTLSLIDRVCDQAHNLRQACKSSQWSFFNQGYEETVKLAVEGDHIYNDPPYIGTNSTYFNTWNEQDHNHMVTRLLASPAQFSISMWLEKGDEISKHGRNLAHIFQHARVEHQYIIGPTAQNRPSVIEGLFFS